MSLGRLAWRHACSRPTRSALTIGAVAVSVFLFSFLRSIVTSLDAAITSAATDRIVVGSAVSLFQALPVAYREAIREIEGVEDVCTYTWFGGRYQKPENFFAQFGTDPAAMLRMYPEVEIAADQREAFIEDRQGAIAGIALVEKYDWKIGDRIPLIGTIYRLADGSEWSFNLRGVYRATRPNVDDVTLFFHWSLLDETLERGDAAGPRGTSVLVVRVAKDTDPAAVAAAIDARYEAGPQRTRTQSEAAFQAGFIGMLGNLPTFLGTIGAAVLVALFFGVINTMTMAGRERTRTFGILGALGFARRDYARLYLLEALLLVGLGVAIGLGAAWLTQPVFRKLFGTQIPMYHVVAETLVAAVLIGLVAAFASGWIPARRAMRLRTAEALRRGT